MSNEKLKGKKAIVTGGSRGIGRGIALTLAAAGADVAFCHHKDNDKAKETSSEIEKLGRKSFAAECDVSSTSSVKIKPPTFLGPFSIFSTISSCFSS